MFKAIYERAISGFYSDRTIIRVVSRISVKLIKKILAKRNPLINYKLNGYNLKFPVLHALPLVMQEYPDYADNLTRVAKCIQQKYSDLTIIDVGANVGDSVFMLKRDVLCPILCIEGDPRFFEIEIRVRVTFYREKLE
jgi:hypothetical protein